MGKVIKVDFPSEYRVEPDSHEAKKYDFAVLTLDTNLGWNCISGCKVY